MKSKGYWFFAFIAIAIAVYFGIKDRAQVEYIAYGYAMENIADEWKNTISHSVNNSDFKFRVDGVEIDAKKKGIYMNTSMVFMIPYLQYRDLFNCSVNFYENSKLVIEKGNLKIVMKVGSNEITMNEVSYVMSAPLVIREDTLYVPIDVAVRGLGYNYNWDIDSNVATIISSTVSGTSLPAQYSYVDAKKNPSVKAQGSLGTCWAMASLTALESSLMPEEKYNFSVDHMSLANSFNLNQYEGGSSTMAMAYLLGWQGPVLETIDPYGDGETSVDAVPYKHVQEVQIIDAKDLQKIKEMVYKYGGVQSSLYTTMQNSYDYSKYYDDETYAYCYLGSEKPNHDVVIIGWDDYYPKENFSVEIESDGAFICQNSWGAEFGDNGIFYVSYYDSNIGMHNIVYTKVENIDNYDSIYQSDLCGWVGKLGYESEEAWFSNVYTAKKTEFLGAVGFYATGMNTEYEVYVRTQYAGVNSLRNGLQKVAEGTLGNAGYYTIEFDELVQIIGGKEYAVVVKIKTPNAKKPVAVEYVSDYYTQTADITDGIGYVSYDGENWIKTEENYQCNVCLKAYAMK